MDRPGDFLDGTTWGVVLIGGREVPSDAPRRVEFSGSRVSGRVGVNRFTGEYTIEGDTVVIGTVARTLMAGPPEMMELEDRFHSAFNGSMPVAVGEIMLLGDVELSYVAPNRLRGTVWYRERMALQPRSTVVVELYDLSSGVLATQTIGDALSPPIEFDLEASQPLEQRTYTIRARIEGPEGDLMWAAETRIDPEQQPVEVMLVRV